MKALAYVHGPERVHRLGRAFAQGCKRHGIACELREVSRMKREAADVVWLYGLGPALPVFESYAGATRVIGDKGYFAEYATTKFFRVSVNAQQPDAHLRRRPHPADRWQALGIAAAPMATRGDYVLLCGVSPKQASRHGVPYGAWERAAFAALSAVTDRPIFVREKPGNPPIAGLPRLPDMPASKAIRGAWAVVCKTGNIGVDAIVEGVPVLAESGPGRVYFGEQAIEALAPLSAADRIRALSDIAYWQWTADEIARGELWEHLRVEGFV